MANGESYEIRYLKGLHIKAGFELPRNSHSLASLRASYNFKAVKAGIPTYTWT